MVEVLKRIVGTALLLHSLVLMQQPRLDFDEDRYHHYSYMKKMPTAVPPKYCETLRIVGSPHQQRNMRLQISKEEISEGKAVTKYYTDKIIAYWCS